MIRAILFDFTGTLVDSAGAFRAAEKAAQARISRDLAVDDRDAFLSVYRSLRSRFAAAMPNFSRQEVWREVYRRHERTPDPETLSAWEADYWRTVREGTALFPDTMSVLPALAARFALGLVTNSQGPGGPDAHSLKRFPRLATFFRCVVIAGEGGVPAKPDAAPFRLCLQRLGVEARDGVHVGDDWRIDVRGARNAGLRPVWIRHRAAPRNWPDGDGSVPIIDSLEPLRDPDALQ